MSTINFLLLVAIAICGFASSEKFSYVVKQFDEPLDHFAFVSNQSFKIRYLINETYAKDKDYSPILFYTGNEGDIELFAQNTGFMWELAVELKASLIFAEHRYYGKSLPFGNESFSAPERSGYLTSEQALADYADLLVALNPKHRPVIAFGGSYGGMLAAWMRMKYPHIIKGAIAASAPILQFTCDCNRFNLILTSVFSTGHKYCAENIRESWNVIKNYSSTVDGRNLLKSKFKFCKNFTKPEDADRFFDYLNDVYGNLAMVNYPYESTFLAPLPAYPVTEFCSYLNTSFSGIQLIDAFQKALSIYSNYTGQTKCLDIDSAYNSDMGASGWDYQSCTEMVMPMCSKVDGTRNMFPPKEWNFDQFSNECFKNWKVRPKQNMATTIYGGNKLRYASNIVFSNGLLDPWSGGGVLKSSNKKIQIIIIPEAAHHLDLRSSSPADPRSVVNAREMEKQAILSWLGESDFY